MVIQLKMKLRIFFNKATGYVNPTNFAFALFTKASMLEEGYVFANIFVLVHVTYTLIYNGPLLILSPTDHDGLAVLTG